MSKHENSLCPCGSTGLYDLCCRPLIDGETLADSPEQLMRSRYSAYSFANEDYLISTWHTSTRPGHINLANGPTIKWTGLEIISAPPTNNSEGIVEFIARFKENGKVGKLHEASRFKKEDGRWYYLSGEIK